MRKIADKVNGYLLADMAHVSGLVAAKVIPSPFEFADIVTTTTHKTLRGPRGALIFFRKGVRKTLKSGEKEMYDLEKKINDAVFPGLQGGPHDHQTASIAVALKEAMEPAFVDYQKQVLANCQVLITELKKLGYKIVTGGSDVHLVLVDFRPQKIDGGRVDHVLEKCGIAVNKNTCPGDVSAFRPSGIRIGSPALTSRNFKEQDFVKVAEFIHKGKDILLHFSYCFYFGFYQRCPVGN